MPNHITNILDISGPAKDLAKFRKQVSSENKELVKFKRSILQKQLDKLLAKQAADPVAFANSFEAYDLPKIQKALKKSEPFVLDFEGTLPMPEELNGTLCPGNTPEQKLLQAGYTKKYGAGNWYDWHCKNWGTKWNAYSIEAVAETGDGLRYQFQTAWSLPGAWLRATAAQFPTLTFVDAWSDEGGGSGRLTIDPESGISEEELTDHEWKMEYNESYQESYELITNGDYKEVIEQYSEMDEIDDWDLIDPLLARLQDKDLPLFLNFEWGSRQEAFETRLKGQKVQPKKEKSK